MCRSRQQAEAALARLTAAAGRARAWSRRRPRPGSCTWRWAARGSTSSASTTGWCASRAASGRRHVTFLARWPADKAMQHARDRIRELTGPVPAAAAGRGGRGRTSTGSCAAGPAYFRYGNSADALRQDQELRADAAGAVHRQTAHAARRGVRLVRAGVCRPRTSSGLISLARNRRRTQALPGLAGETECRR